MRDFFQISRNERFAHDVLQLPCRKLPNRDFVRTKLLVRDFLHSSHFEAENRRFPVSLCYKPFFRQLNSCDFCEASATLQGIHKMLPLPRILTPCHLRSPATAIQPSSIVATSQNVAPATRLDDAPGQNAVPATTKKGRDNKRYIDACRNTQQNTLFARKSASSTSS